MTEAGKAEVKEPGGTGSGETPEAAGAHLLSGTRSGTTDRDNAERSTDQPGTHTGGRRSAEDRPQQDLGRRLASLADADAVLPRAGRRAADMGDATPQLGRRAAEGRTAESDDAPQTGRRAAEARTADSDDAPQTGRRAAEARTAESDDAPQAGRRAAGKEPPRTGDGGRRSPDGPLRPGDVGQAQIRFWDDEAIAHFRGQWHDVKGEFVEDPETALTRAHDLLTDAVNELTEALLAERDELDPLRTTKSPDTESMRMAMRGYREFLDRILAL